MLVLQFYRLYISFAVGGLIYFSLWHRAWIWIAASILVRVLWFAIEKRIEALRINHRVEQHAFEFKQQLGPYGIRMINKAESDPMVRQSLAEVFTPDIKALKKAVEQLEMMDTLFKAGMRPDGDAYQLHDLKLKYGKYRLEKVKSRSDTPSKP
jgi:hypothetical protein